MVLANITKCTPVVLQFCRKIEAPVPLTTYHYMRNIFFKFFFYKILSYKMTEGHQHYDEPMAQVVPSPTFIYSVNAKAT